MARIALAGFLHETNTFAPLPTNFESFTGKNGHWMDKPEEFAAMKAAGANISTVGFMTKAEEFGHEVFPILLTYAQPACTVSNDAFKKIMAAILEGLKLNGPFDAVYLDLHGAMVTEDFDDPETEAQRQIRQVVGNIPIIASFDLHGNIPQRAVDEFSALVGYRSYPHIDMFETGERAAVLADHLLQGKPLKKAYRQSPYLISPSTASTFTEPCLSIYKTLDEIEKEKEVRSVTFMHGFLLSDIKHAGPSVFAYADTQAAARCRCRQAAAGTPGARSQFCPESPPACRSRSTGDLKIGRCGKTQLYWLMYRIMPAVEVPRIPFGFWKK